MQPGQQQPQMQRRYVAAAAPPPPYSAAWCRQKRFGTANIVQLLRQREQGARREGSHFVRGSREFYFSLRIGHTSVVVHRPQILPLRFTPCGNKLVALSANMQEILLFTYRGFQYGTNKTGEELFNSVFPHCQRVHLWNMANAATGLQQFGFLSRECCLITPDSRFLVVTASVMVPECKANFRAILRNNESLSPDQNLADITFYSVDLNKALLVDRHKFECDQIAVHSGGCGVYLAGWTLAILSVQHQTVHMLGIDRAGGHFVPLMNIGHSVLADDQLLCSGSAHQQLINARTERCFTAFRQRFLAHLYKEYQRKGQVHQFLYHFDFFRHLKMHKLQFVGPELLLIRMEQHQQNDGGAVDAASSSSAAVSSPPFPPFFAAGGGGQHHHQNHHQQHMFVLLEWRVGRIWGAFTRSSDALFALFERHNELFRNGHCARAMFPTSMEHCGAERAQHEFIKQSSLLAAPASDVRRRFMAALPFPNTQHLVASPYLDPNMFSYDDKLGRLVEQGRYPPDQSLKLFSRRTKNLHTKLDFRAATSAVGDRTVASSSSLCHTARVLFHPVDPFVLSVCRGVQPETLITFHTPNRAQQ